MISLPYDKYNTENSFEDKTWVLNYWKKTLCGIKVQKEEKMDGMAFCQGHKKS